eukprot:3784738-Rhodomonas_salina.1
MPRCPSGSAPPATPNRRDHMAYWFSRHAYRPVCPSRHPNCCPACKPKKNGRAASRPRRLAAPIEFGVCCLRSSEEDVGCCRSYFEEGAACSGEMLNAAVPRSSQEMFAADPG